MLRLLGLGLLAGCAVLSVLASARADNIDTTLQWNGNSSFFPFGVSNTATYGQLITPTTEQTNLRSFSFYLSPLGGDVANARMQAFVYQWDTASGHITGDALFTSSVINGPTAAGFTPVVVPTGSVKLAQGQQYVMFLTTTTISGQPSYGYNFGFVSASSYPEGRIVFQNNSGTGFDGLSTNGWVLISANFAFIALLGPSDAKIAAELTIQAAEQGVMMTDAQTRAIVGQIRDRMSRSGVDSIATAALAYGPEEKTVSYDMANGTVVSKGNWTAWADTSADGFRGDWNPEVTGYQFRQQFGFDYQLANGWIAGVAVGGGAFENKFDGEGRLSGNAFWVEPYLGMNVGGWTVALQAAYTRTSYNSFDTGVAVSESAHGDRISGSATVSREFALGGGYYVTPEAAISAGAEKLSGLKVLQTKVDDASFVNTRFGGEIGYKTSPNDRVYGLAFAEYTSTSGNGEESYLSTGYQADRWSATLGGGLDTKLGERTRIALEGRVRGIGSDTLIYGASARLSLGF